MRLFLIIVDILLLKSNQISQKNYIQILVPLKHLPPMKIYPHIFQKNQENLTTNVPEIQRKQTKMKPCPGRKPIAKKDHLKKNQRSKIIQESKHDNSYTDLQCHVMTIEETTQQIGNSSSIFKQAPPAQPLISKKINFIQTLLDKNSNSDLQRNSELKEQLQSIFSHLSQKETNYIPKAILDPINISEGNRTKLIAWIFQLSERFHFKLETIYSAINIVDRALGLTKFSLEMLPLLGITALFMATKYEEILIPHLTNFVSAVPQMYRVTKNAVLEMENILLQLFEFNLGYTCPLLFIHYYSYLSQLSSFVKEKAIAHLKSLILRSQCRYWPTSKLAAHTIKLAEEGQKCIASQQVLSQFNVF